MKVIFFEPYALAIPHFETALELMEIHLKDGDEVLLFHCDANLNSCESNYTHSLATCMQCISRRKNGIKTLTDSHKVKSSNFVSLLKAERELIDNWNVSFKSIADLKAYRYENIDMGMAIASSLISFHRNPEPNILDNHYLIKRLFKASLKVYLSFKKILNAEKPDLVYLFNGRFSNIRPVIRLCELNNINYKIHERGSNRTKYSLHQNHLPHDFIHFQKQVELSWGKALESERTKIAEAFYYDRKAGKEQAWHSFVANQKEKELPPNWDHNKRNIVVFNSSEDEFAAIGDSLKDRVFPTQLDGMKFVADLVENRSDIAVYIRIHPNLKGINNSTVTGIHNIKCENFHIIEAESTISSYQLIDSAEAVVTFGSTVGIESTFWGKPSILLGDSFYKDLGSTYNPKSKDEFADLLLNESAAKDRLGAYKYGFYVNTYGIEYNYYSAEGLFAGKFKGKKIRPSSWIKKYLKRKQFLPIVKFISRIHADRF